MSIQTTDIPFSGPPRHRLLLLTRRYLQQAAIVGVAVALVVWFGCSVRHALAQKGIQFSFGYLWNSAGISLSEGVVIAFEGLRPILRPFSSTDTNAQALLAGLGNTLKVTLSAILLSTAFGTIVGIGRLSTNWLVRNLSFGLVECVRNTPLLIQIVFWYFAVVLRFPPADAASSWFGGLIASRSGVFLPGIAVSDVASPVSWSLLVCGFGAAFAALFVGHRATKAALCAASAAAVTGSIIVGFPLALDLPVATRFGANGGTVLTPEMTAILLAIVVNSSAYVAEIVRGAIDALPKGQWEASAALGLSRSHTLRDIILPQVFRVVLPSFANRYISLTKDTSLGIAIGYPDLFNVSGTVSNQTGRNLEGVIIVMLTYLVLSWIISACMNLINARANARGGS
ncbi:MULTISPECIES: ABC transporter permease subunit [Bradyrhizobium]|uniref:ABC transporter permease subunit n=1 Tax=Bradyrhizobium septentrionale TaxID=1404411 RepID=A0A973W6M5_9BRAD|nr:MULTISPECIES: ABC transporter permease subunit [Bradyrhizobium]MCK7666165.1 ABC transporter permease subunit [Bradyrhizobium sp. 2S1]QIG94473.1 ABC transporter permease subunit [Bradyrhizobium sp. 6(2017)]UGY16935.1 ABC transporter permease subunit [Bradyrhizobium septentrionale]UGY25690.1 ABC transporter permease subunit [Bradyrhizobium septentrionale]